MAAYNFHREIFEDSTNATEAEICTIQCDPLKNPTGGCTPTCAVFCSTFCPTIYSSTPPQSPPPPTDSYILSTPPKHHHSPLSLPLKISLVILVVTFSLFLLYTLYKFYTVWYRSRRRRSPPSPPSPGNQETHDEFLDHDVLDHPIWYIRTIGLQPSVINAITVLKYSKADGLVEGTYCSVCLSEFQEDETLRLLPKCNHAFHISCIDTWLRSHTNCPLCRAGIVKNTTNSSSSDQNLDDSGPMEETQVAISIPEEVDRDESQREEDYQSSELRIGVVEQQDLNDKTEVVAGSGTSDFLIMRRSVSLNDYAASRVRSDVHTNYYSDRHEVQIQSSDSDLGIEWIKVDQTANNCSKEGD